MPATTRLTQVNLIPLITAQGYPEPCREFSFALPQGLWRFDYAWPRYWLALEREGNTWVKGKSRHTTGQGYRDDIDKYNEAALRNWCVLRCTADMLQDGTIWTLLERALRQKGWNP